MIEINFSHDYFKLREQRFTTIRSKHYLKNKGLRVGDVVKIKHPSGEFPAKIVGVEVKRICDIPLEILKKDAEFEGFNIKTHQDFVDLLNSFIPYKSNKLTTEKAIIYLERV
ncbi:hypothetical protein [Methanocaldococcus jannaschii]|nr:hypothetical protein [Methanocaldococcus jannaschii]